MQLSTEMRKKRDGSLLSYFNHQFREKMCLILRISNPSWHFACPGQTLLLLLLLNFSLTVATDSKVPGCRYVFQLHCSMFSVETMEWETPALNLRWSLGKTRRVNMWWHVGSTLCVAGVSRPWSSSAPNLSMCRAEELGVWITMPVFLSPCGAN